MSTAAALDPTNGTPPVPAPGAFGAFICPLGGLGKRTRRGTLVSATGVEFGRLTVAQQLHVDLHTWRAVGTVLPAPIHADGVVAEFWLRDGETVLDAYDDIRGWAIGHRLPIRYSRGVTPNVRPKRTPPVSLSPGAFVRAGPGGTQTLSSAPPEPIDEGLQRLRPGTPCQCPTRHLASSSRPSERYRGPHAQWPHGSILDSTGGPLLWWNGDYPWRGAKRRCVMED